MTVKGETDLSLKRPSKFQLISYNIILPYERSGAPKASFTTRVYISFKFFFFFIVLCNFFISLSTSAP